MYVYIYYSYGISQVDVSRELALSLTFFSEHFMYCKHSILPYHSTSHSFCCYGQA